MTPEWIAKRIQVPDEAEFVLVPGYCEEDLTPVEAATRLPVERGPRDLRMLPEFLGEVTGATEYGGYDIEILAEINHAPNLTRDELLAEAARLRSAGADIIDVGCEPGNPWNRVGEAVAALRGEGHRVSIDSLDAAEIAAAVRAGAELVLSVNATNRDAAADWSCPVVVIPDDAASGAGLDETVEHLAATGVPLIIDPVLSPIGFGFAESLRGYYECRRRYPDAEMMMGIGNLTELTEVDSAGVNLILLAICQELGIRHVLTTEVIGWARSAVRECDVARRLTYHAIRQRVLPKHVDPRLVMLRDPQVPQFGAEELAILAASIRDNNYRILIDGGRIHVLSHELHLEGTDPFLLFEQLAARQLANLDPSHAFYLGFEMAKAAIALNLGKDYRQDEALQWGLLTVEEKHHRLKRGQR
jgi:dihydropteroate synthase-like protein